MAFGAVRQVTWSDALVRKIYSRTARVGFLGFSRAGFALSADFARAGFHVAEASHGAFPDILFAAASCPPERIAANVRSGMLVVIDSGSGASALQSLLERSGLQAGQDVFLCCAAPGDPPLILGATQECAKLGCALFLQVVASVTPSVRHRIDDVVDSYAHPER